MEKTQYTAERAGAVAATGTHIWLRYATQFSAGNRQHTVEMGIPVPIGASAEERELLLREAEAGMSQLVQHVEGRISQMLARPSSAQTGTARPTSPTTTAASAVPPKVAPRPTAMTASAPRAATTPASMPSSVREAVPAQENTAEEQEIEDEEIVPPNRTTVGASMPRTPTTSLDLSSNLSLGQFIELIRDHLGLNPKQAMQYLNVKSLSGLNLRDALERLQSMKASGAPGAATPSAGSGNEQSATVATPASANANIRTATPPAQGANTGARNAALSATTGSAGRSAPPPSAQSSTRSYNTQVREDSSALAFDEEIGADDDLPSINDEDELEDLDDSSFILTPEERHHAAQIVNDLRNIRGATLANAGRIQALHNIVDSQIDKEQLLGIIQGIWNVQNEKKLKVDQLERLISWAKEDEFVSEVEIVLAYLEEQG